MHNFVILSPNLDFQESILVKISQALILFNYILPNQSQLFRNYRISSKFLKHLHAREISVFLTESSKKALVNELGSALRCWKGSKRGRNKLGSGFLRTNTSTHTCMHIRHVSRSKRRKERKGRCSPDLGGEEERKPGRRGGRRWWRRRRRPCKGERGRSEGRSTVLFIKTEEKARREEEKGLLGRKEEMGRRRW